MLGFPTRILTLLPVAMAVKKDVPLVTHLPHVKKVIDEAPPEYIIMIVVAFLQVFAMTISLVHVQNKHRSFTRMKPGMVGPTIALLSFYWFIATLNVLGLFVLRANLLCQAIGSCYDALIGYMFAVLLVSYSNGKLSYFSVLRWRDVITTRYTCSSVCCCNSVTRGAAARAVTLIVQLIVVFCATCLAELICENEELYLYPAPLYKSYITLGLKCVQALSLLASLYGFIVLCRAASITQPKTSPFIKLFLYKSIYILSAVQGNTLLYLAFSRVLPAVSDIEPVTRAVVWSNFATVTECTFAYFLAVRIFKVDDYTLVQGQKSDRTKTLDRIEKENEFYRTTFEGPSNTEKRQITLERRCSEDVNSLSTPEMELDSQNLLSLKLLGLNVKLPDEMDDKLSLNSYKRDSLRRVHRDSLQSVDSTFVKPKLDFSSDEDLIPNTKQGKLKKSTRSSHSTEAMLGESAARNHRPPKSASLMRTEKVEQGYTKLSHEDGEIEPKVSIVGGKVNISLSSKDLAKLCKSSAAELNDAASISLSIGKLSSNGTLEEAERGCSKGAAAAGGKQGRVTFDETVPSSPEPKNGLEQGPGKSSRHSMQFVTCYSSDSDESVTTPTDPSQYVSKISLV